MRVLLRRAVDVEQSTARIAVPGGLVLMQVVDELDPGPHGLPAGQGARHAATTLQRAPTTLLLHDVRLPLTWLGATDRCRRRRTGRTTRATSRACR